VRLAGSRQFAAGPEVLWRFLLTPERLRRCLPGCESFGPSGPDTFAATLRLGIAFLTGTYRGTIRVVEQRRPDYLVLAVDGGGPLGALTARGHLTFRSPHPGLTELIYEGEVDVRGRIAALGERVVELTAGRLIGQFFACMAEHLDD
jgi:carbon monoxide dehydrogenase subunit G